MRFLGVPALMAVLMSAPVMADALDAFYADAENARGFAAAQASGQIAQGRQRMLAMCAEAKLKTPAADCGCVERELAGVSDRAFYFESVLAYREYQEKVDALRAEDTARYAQLKAQHAQRMGLARRLEAACGMV